MVLAALKDYLKSFHTEYKEHQSPHQDLKSFQTDQFHRNKVWIHCILVRFTIMLRVHVSLQTTRIFAYFHAFLAMKHYSASRPALMARCCRLVCKAETTNTQKISFIQFDYLCDFPAIRHVFGQV